MWQGQAEELREIRRNHGGTTDLIVTLATSGTLTVVANSVRVWLTQRRSDLTLEISSQDGTKRSLTARKIKDPHAFAREMLEAFSSMSGHSGGTTDRR